MGKKGYGRVTNKAMKLTHYKGVDLNRTDKFVLFTLIVKQGATNEARIANRVLATMADLGIRTIQRSVEKLERIGLITRLKLGKYSVASGFLHLEGEGFGEVYLDVLQSELSIYAKLLYVVNTVASGKDHCNFVKRENMMKYSLMCKDKYVEAMKELEEKKIIEQERRYRDDESGNILRASSYKYMLSPEEFELTSSNITNLNKKKSDIKRTEKATIAGHSLRQKDETNDDNIRTAYYQYSATTCYHEEYTADSLNHGIFLWNSYRGYFIKGFNASIINDYDCEDVLSNRVI